MAVDEHRAFGRFPEASDESGKRSLTASCRADDGERGTSRDLQVDIRKHGVRTAAVGLANAIGAIAAGKGRWVGKRKIPEFDFTARSRILRKSCGAIVDAGFGGQDEIQATYGSRAALENIGDPAERDHRPNEHG